MKIEIKYYVAPSDGDSGIIPVYDQSEFIVADTMTEVDEYINKKVDVDGNKYLKKSYAGFDFISLRGGIILKKI